ncbi:MAG: LytTR family DNA-binding domain-containing protein [Lachnospiraceae bacterium]|nr:LytTR family DNA-binding domain-containing protein [Lachnospiraceae bacterium]
MKVAIVDDEQIMTDQLSDFLSIFKNENDVIIETEVYHSGDEFLKDFESKRVFEEKGADFDLLLLDVELPGLNGIETAKKVREHDKNVIIMFITNMAQYAIHGYDVEAIDYVLKPITYDDFALKMNKAMRYIKQNEKQQMVLNTTDDGRVPIMISDIYYIEVVSHYLKFHTKQGVLESRGVMKEIEKTLGEMNFFRCNQSYLVNLAYVKSIRSNEVNVGGDSLSISRNRKNSFMEAFTKYVGGMS